ncbi:hypothetical protein EI200_25405 [Peribacillus simplex]|uniref:hypothetical protein n=1 Tax=Peribacillus simplex TaxID=1478 RepID=UPI000F6367F1|nr:hypothetical protein [Peribacillus simplex]RRN66706.1 hypothetical protein EI200_25405 [Peribacillus simplex]
MDVPAEKRHQPLNAEKTIDYFLANDLLNISFDKGSEWIKVPVEKDKFFDGEYNGNKQELILCRTIPSKQMEKGKRRSLVIQTELRL